MARDTMTTAPTSLRHRLTDNRRDDRGSVTVWMIGATVGSILLLALVLNGGILLRARSDAFSLAAAAARAGAQQLDADAAVEGRHLLDPAAAEQAALAHLTARGATGSVTVTAQSVTVTVSTTAHLQTFALIGGGSASFSATATVDIVKVANP